MIRIERILCPIDFSDFSSRALAQAVAVATWYRAELTVLYVFQVVSALDLPPRTLKDPDREQLVGEMRRFAGAVPSTLSIRFVVREASDVREEILAQTETLETHLLVIGSHGRPKFDRLVLGSVTEKIIRKATCPVMVVPPQVAGTPVGPGGPRVLCPIDFSEGSARALAYAIDIAREARAELTLLYVIELPPDLYEFPVSPDADDARATAEADSLRRLHELISEPVREQITVKEVVREGSAYRQILQQASEQPTDLIVMGVQGRGPFDRLMFGSNSEHVIRSAACPVLTIP